MNFSDLIERLAKTSTQAKILGILGISAFFCAAFYFLFYSDLLGEEDRLERQITALKQEKAGYEDKKQRYMAFRAEVSKLLEEHKEIVKILPPDANIPAFLSAIHAQAELSGLNILTYDQQTEVPQDFYARIPVRLSISGTYHQISKFFYAVGRLKRIVNMQNLLLGSAKATDQGVVLKAQFEASTFRFLATGGNKPKPQG